MGLTISVIAVLFAVALVNIVVFWVLLSAVKTVFRIEKSTIRMDVGLHALHEELREVKQELLSSKR